MDLRFCFVNTYHKSMVTFAEAEETSTVTAVAIFSRPCVVYVTNEFQLQYSFVPHSLKINIFFLISA